MARHSGRDLTIDWDSVTLVGVQSKEFTLGAEFVDVTTDDDDGFQTTLAKPGKRSAEVSVSGITEDQIIIAAFMATSVGETLTINLPTATGGQIEGTFRVTEFAGSGEHDGSYEFSATFQSSGAFVYTAGTP